MPLIAELQAQPNAPIPTWFGVGGGADHLARPVNTGELRRCLEADRSLRILGDGANLLVADEGVGNLVVSLAQGEFAASSIDPAAGRITAGAGVNLPRLILEAAKAGLAGLEGLGGIPATIGGAIVMNAGGTFAQICDVVARVHGLDRSGSPVTLERGDIDFSYRHSGLNDLVVTSVDLRLKRDDPSRVRARLKEVMAYKKKSQPLGDRSAGCVFKNPTLRIEIPNIGVPGARVSAGMLLDKAGCKGMTVGGAAVSSHHANFFTARKGCTAGDMILLIEQARARVADRFGVTLDTEVVIWKRA
ncbi:MAG: UDP-N-acetylmuramate dehydrogenase [Phycisphaeraceae bacterium]|nr:UDP-N-acetylmuramate dehydrogenase [Phycisphaeraceae bacterium]